MEAIRADAGIFIQAPVEQVWEALTCFETWPQWARHVREVRKQSQGWRFVVQKVSLMDQVWVARHISIQTLGRLVWESIPQAQHNAQTQGWIQLEPTTGGTHLQMHLEAGPDFSSRLLNRFANLWTALFTEPEKHLGGFLQDLKRHVETATVPVLDLAHPAKAA